MTRYAKAEMDMVDVAEREPEFAVEELSAEPTPEATPEPEVVKATSLLIQVAWDDGLPLLDLTRQRHADWCQAHGFDYWDGCAGMHPQVNGMWRRHFCIQDALAQYDFVAYLDADCLIADLSADLRDALPADQVLGMVYDQVEGGEPVNYNAGTIYMRSDERVRRFFAAFLAQYPADGDEGPGRWWEKPHGEQRIISAMLLTPPWNTLPYKVNRRFGHLYFYPGAERAAVVAWHGIPTLEGKLAAMKEHLSVLAK